MRTFTNLIRPDDPYRVGRHLFRKQPPLLAGFAAIWVDDGERAVPVSAAMVYLRLHRIQEKVLDPERFDFGFRSVATIDADETGKLVEVADLDLLQARQHAAVLAGHSFLDDLYGLSAAAAIPARGVRAVEEALKDSAARRRGMAQIVDTALGDDPASPDLRVACMRSGVTLESAWRGLSLPFVINDQHARGQEGDETAVEWLAAAAVEKALAVALVAGRMANRCTWPGKAHIGGALEKVAWDGFPSLLPAPGSDQPTSLF
ncbi:hypothetical protein [Streptosporangium sp. NPDC002524]|uniref:hypothetical protein n=1 Tax=Streptosporangium sp. NPDC002524 TaxID=3154537 RepID=UPI003328357D